MSRSLRDIVEKYFTDEGLDDCFYLYDTVAGAKIEVFIDSDKGVSFDLCRKVSRVIEAVIDETKEYGEKYTLNVSSAGVGAPLMLPRQYINNIGRTLEVKHHDKKSVGEIIAADEEKVTISYETVRKEGKKKIKESVQESIKYDEITAAKIKISFK